MRRSLLVVVLITAFVIGSVGSVFAIDSYLTTFNSKYGKSWDCGVCHWDTVDGGGTRNAYGNAFAGVSSHSSNPNGAFDTIASRASVCSGYTYLQMITQGLYPGGHGNVVTCPTPAPLACTSYTYTLGACQPSNTAPVLSYVGIPSGCSGGAVPATTQPCTYTPPACTSYTYTLGTCQSNNTAPVLSYAGIPPGCSGGLSPATTQPCTYVAPTPGTPGYFWDSVNYRMGINVATPQHALDVVAPDSLIQWSDNTADGTTKAARMVLRHYSNSALPVYLFGAASTGINNFIALGGGSSLGNAATQIDFFTAPTNTTPLGNSRMTITSGGDIGIGTSAPTHLLQLSGGAYSDGAVWTNASSRELKENIKDLSTSEAVEALKGLRAVKYNYKTDPTDKHVGFIAEDVPDLVATKDRKGLSPMDIVAVVTKVMQSQQETIEAQQKTISALSEKLADLQREVRQRGSVASAGAVEVASPAGN